MVAGASALEPPTWAARRTAPRRASFLTIGGVWLAHHGIFARLRYVDSTLMRLNLVLLMVARLATLGVRFRGRRWLVTGWVA